MKNILTKIAVMLFALLFNANSFSQVNIIVDIAKGKREVSPYIYGKNNSTSHSPGSPTSKDEWIRIKDAGVTMLRESEGNNSTKYNWRKKLLSAPDWYNQVSPCDWDYEAKELQKNYPEAQGMWSFQLLGKVASSTTHNFDAWTFHIENNLPWPPVSTHQNLTGGGIPNTQPGAKDALQDGDINLYLQDWPVDSSVAILDHWFGQNGIGLDKSKIQYWCMDNEVEIWSGTHDDVPALTAEQFIQNYVRAAKLARQKYPEIKLVGPATCNEWFWYASWGETDPKVFLKFFIKRIAEEQQACGMKLLDVLDIHFYPGGTDPQQIVQYPRVYFDRNYAFPLASGVALVNGGWDTTIKEEYIFERCRQWLEQYMGPDHGVTFGVTETGINDVDASVTAVWYASNMGEFMSHNVEVFTPWSWKKGMWETLHLFSRYNKPYYIQSVSDDEELVSAYPTLSVTEDTLVVVLVNRSVTETKNTTVNLNKFLLGDQTFKMRTLSELPDVETFKNHYENALATTTVSKNGNTITVSLPPMSVSSLELFSKEKPAISAAKVEDETPSVIDLKLTVPVTLPVSFDGMLVKANNTDTIDITQIQRSVQDSSMLMLTLERPLINSDSVVISYADGKIMTYDSLFMKNAADFLVDNLLYGASPRLSSVKTENPERLLLSFNKKMKHSLKEGFNLYFTSGSAEEIIIDSVEFKGNDSTLIVLYMPAAIGFKDSLKLTYTGNTMMSVDAGYLRPFEMAVENTLLPPSPQLVAADVSDFGYSITLEYDIEMFSAFGEKSHFTVKANGRELDIDKLSTNSKIIVVWLKDLVNSGDTVTFGYSGGSLASTEGGKAADVTDYIVTNSLPEATVFSIPGKVEAEKSVANNGTKTESTSDTGGGLNVGWIDDTDWVEYAINVEKAGVYTIFLRVAANTSAGKIIVQLPENNFSNIDTIDIPVTGGWQKWTTVKSCFNLESGVQRLRFYVYKGGFNINWFELKPGDYNIRPVLVGATVTESGTAVELAYDLDLADFTGNPGDFSLRVAGAEVGITSVSLSSDSKTVVLTLTDTITQGESVLLSYEEGSVVSVPGALAASYTDQIVSNNSVIVSVLNPLMPGQILLFPSPADRNIEFKSPVIVDKVEIIDFMGKTIANIQVNTTGTVIEIGGILSPGIYFMKFYTRDAIVVKRFIKE